MEKQFDERFNESNDLNHRELKNDDSEMSNPKYTELPRSNCQSMCLEARPKVRTFEKMNQLLGRKNS